MRRLILSEFRPRTAVELSVSERDAVRRLHPGIRIEPTLGFDDRYDLTPDQRIGLVCLPDLVIEVRPKIPTSSVLFLVSHACDSAVWFDQQPEFSHDSSLVEAIAVILARLIEQATRRGLLNGYRCEDDSLQTPRGRILFDEQLRRRLGRSPPVEVRHDVFTADILENRLLLAALAVLGRLPLRSVVAKREVIRAQRLFGAVTRMHFAPATVPDVVFTRLNRHYQSAVSLAGVVLRSASVELGAGGVRGSAFLIDMNTVFERFVRNALRDTLGVGRSTFPDLPPKARLDKAGLIPLKPDLCFLQNDRIVWVGDAKYKRLPFGAYDNADLYQLLAYAVALGLPGGTLVYAAHEGVGAAEHVVVKAGKRLRVVAIDLSASPAKILQQVRTISDCIRLSVREGGSVQIGSQRETRSA